MLGSIGRSSLGLNLFVGILYGDLNLSGFTSLYLAHDREFSFVDSLRGESRFIDIMGGGGGEGVLDRGGDGDFLALLDEADFSEDFLDSAFDLELLGREDSFADSRFGDKVLLDDGLLVLDVSGR